MTWSLPKLLAGLHDDDLTGPADLDVLKTEFRHDAGSQRLQDCIALARSDGVRLRHGL